jgi:hypothetical protein
MNGKGAVSAVCIASTVAAAAAARDQATPSSGRKADVVVVRGCVTGRALVADPTTGSITSPRYELKGSMEMLAALAAHSKHIEEISGKLKGDDAGGGTRAGDRRRGKNRVYAGRSESNRETAQIASAPTIAVTAFEHISDNCSQAARPTRRHLANADTSAIVHQ